MILACLVGCEDSDVSVEVSLAVMAGSLELGMVGLGFDGAFIGNGCSIRHTGSLRLEGSEDEDIGRSRTTDELSHSWSILGEYAGVDGSESMNVPKDLADIGGGDKGPSDLGVIGVDTRAGGG
jgi:hypothetical protein